MYFKLLHVLQAIKNNMGIHDDNKLTIKSILTAILISIVIGTIFLLIGANGHKIKLANFLWNAGYSTSLGLGLFSNGFIYRFVEKKYISWIESPLKSILIAISVHLLYSTVVIIFFNWLWFILIQNQTISEFLENGWFIRWTAISASKCQVRLFHERGLSKLRGARNRFRLRGLPRSGTADLGLPQGWR